MNDCIFLKRVVLNNYKSIKECSVSLGALTFLVGQNGAGKSNFLDALRLVTESLNTSLEHALRDRGGIGEVRRRSSGHPTYFGVRLEWILPDGSAGMYAFRIKSQEEGGLEVKREECEVWDNAAKKHFFKIENGLLKDSSFGVGPVAAKDRLYLVSVSGLPEFRPLYNALSHMGFYNINPEVIRELQSPDTGEVLKRDGSNLASVLRTMSKTQTGAAHNYVVEFLSKIVPGIQSVEVKPTGKKETLEFRQLVGTNKDPWRFVAENMSDGTLRALGVLVGIFQFSNNGTKKVPFVGIEEPEVALHPGAAGVLRDSLRMASKNTQIVVTSHSPDLLDDKSISEENILAVVNKNGETRIGPLDSAGKSAIRDRLYTAGELLRLGQMEPDEALIDNVPLNQLELFADDNA